MKTNNKNVSHDKEWLRKVEDAIHSIRSELDDTIKHRAEDVLVCVEPKDTGLSQGRLIKWRPTHRK
jgi:hypothetical protein